MADWWTAAIPAAVGLGSALLGSSAARSAGNAQAAALDRASDATLQGQREQLAQNAALAAQSRADLGPWRDTGGSALYQLADLYGVGRPDGQGGMTAPAPFEGTPGYQFRFGEGLRAVNADASARGLIDSGSRLRALLGLGQGMAAGEFGDYRNSIQSLAGVGQTATGQQVGANANLMAANQAANNAATSGLTNLYTQGGANAASTQIGQANAITSGLNNALIGYAYLNR